MASLMTMVGEKSSFSPVDNKYMLIDFSHLSHRNLFVASVKIDKTPKAHYSFVQDTSDYLEIVPGSIDKSIMVIDMFYHLMLTSIISMKSKFNIKPENIILCLDSTSWRKKQYPLYKAHRKDKKDSSELNWGNFYIMQNKLVEVIESYTKIKIAKVKDAEADDIIFTLSDKLGSTGNQVIVCTSDKDLKQTLVHPNVSMWDPMKQEMLTDFSEEDILRHILIGDSSDNIPSIKDGCIFDDEFLKHLKSKNIFLSSVEEVEQLEIFSKILEEYKGKKVYKAGNFAEGKAQKLIDSGLVQEELESNPLFKKHFERNKVLIDMRFIPEDIVSSITQTYDNFPIKDNDMFSLMDWSVKHKLKEFQKNMSNLLM